MKFKKLYRTPSASAAVVCAAMLLAGPAARSQETTEKVTVDDVDRTFMVRLPRGYDAKQHYPVVVLLHGMNQDADDMERLTRFDELADKDGIIAVYPIALHGRWNIGVQPQERRAMGGPGGRRGRYGGGGGGYPGGGGGGGYPGGGGGYPGGGGGQGRGQQPDDSSRHPAPADDISYFNNMLDQMGTKFSIDTSRIYAAGLSEGGFMSLRLGCALGDRFAGVAAVGAAMPKTMICLPSRPVPVVMINGTSDPVVPYGGGTEHNLDLAVISVEDSAKAWAKMDRCDEKPEHSKQSGGGKGATEAKVDTYGGCQQSSSVVAYSLKGAGNTWPGGMQYQVEKQIGKTADDFKANDVLWSFLVSKKLPDKNTASQ
jgi:poly(3-hydroxybutyrate) depolymerase